MKTNNKQDIILFEELASNAHEGKAMAQKQHGFRWFRLMKGPINFMTDLVLRRCIPIDI